MLAMGTGRPGEGRVSPVSGKGILAADRQRRMNIVADLLSPARQVEDQVQ